MSVWKTVYVETKEYPFSQYLRENEYLKEGLDFQITADGEVYFSGSALLSEVSCLRRLAIENSEKIKELQKLNKSLLRKLKGVRQRRKADIRHYETVLRYADKSANESALRETALIEENKRLREALETICAIYEINGAEWRFDKRLYDVAKEALDNGSESRD